jgi:hypothetical protein
VKPLVAMREALTDPELLGWVLPGETWAAWRTVLIGTFGEALTDDERAIWRDLTGRDQEPGEMAEEALWLVGRRGGKSRVGAVAASYVAGLCDHSAYLAPGERGLAAFLAQTQKQAGVVFGYTKAIFERSPLLAGLVTNTTADTLELSNGVDLEVRPASYRSARGITAVIVIGDEAAYWSLEGSVNADVEILGALRPSLATTGGPLILITSPYARRGETYELHKAHHGPNGDSSIVVVQAPSRTLNPSLSQRVVDRAYARDPARAAAEYGAQFRTDVEALLTLEAVEACIDPDVYERPRLPGLRYVAFADPSGGSSDSMTLAIGHREGDGAMLDCVRERKPPFSPESVVKEFAETLKSYGLTTVTGDRYAGMWPRERFAVHGIEYRVADKPKSDLYAGTVAVVNSASLRLLDHPVLKAQLVGLERRTARGGRDSIDHAPGGHDDLANAVAGMAHLAMVRRQVEPSGACAGVEIVDRYAASDAGDLIPADGW